MSETFTYKSYPKFIFYTNYKAMFSSIFFTLSRYFPNIEKNIDLSKEHLDDYLKLTIVRNPYTRFLSLYLDKCITDPKNKSQFETGIFLQPSQAQILEAYNKIKKANHPIAQAWCDLTNKPEELKICKENFKLLQTISFFDFMEIARVILLSFKNPDPHFQPQYIHLYRGEDLIPNYVYKMENIMTVWPKICKQLEKEMELGWENKTQGKSSLKYLEDQSIRRNIFALYREDFERFNYS